MWWRVASCKPSPFFFLSGHSLPALSALRCGHITDFWPVKFDLGHESVLAPPPISPPTVSWLPLFSPTVSARATLEAMCSRWQKFCHHGSRPTSRAECLCKQSKLSVNEKNNLDKIKFSLITDVSKPLSKEEFKNRKVYNGKLCPLH